MNSKEAWTNPGKEIILLQNRMLPEGKPCEKPAWRRKCKQNEPIRTAPNPAWHAAAERYSEFLRRHKGTKTLFLELGTGHNTPGIIKYPFWRMAAEWPKAGYASINLGEAWAPEEIRQKAVCIQGNIGETIKNLKNE